MDAMTPVNAYLLALLRACLTETTAPEKPEDVSWRSLLAAAKHQSVSFAAFSVIQTLQARPEGEDLEQWKIWCTKMMAKGANQTVEAQKLMDAFQKAGLRAMPLKGYYTRQLYPQPEMREMTDLDILVDDDRSRKMQDFMAAQGYVLDGMNQCHAEYKKPPYLMVELHNSLVSNRYLRLRAYYRNPWKMAAATPEHPLIYQMNPSDTFVFEIAHFYKHYYYYGCGIRMLADLWLFLRHNEALLDRAYIEKNLKRQKTDVFARTAVALCRTWFEDGAYDDDQRAMEDKLLRGGLHGQKSMYDEIQIERYAGRHKNTRMGKIRYFLSMVFPSRKEMELQYPFLKKTGVLLPVAWAMRGFRILFRSPGHIGERYHKVASTREDK